MTARILAATGAALILSATVATADTATLTGKLKKPYQTSYSPAAGSKATLKVKTTDGVVKKVSSATIKGMGVICYTDGQREQETGRTKVDASLGSFTVKRINSNGKVFYAVNQTRRKVGGKEYNFTASFVTKAGKKATGNVNVSYNDRKCTGSADFTVK